MSRQLTPLELKEVLIEWASREWKTGFLLDVSPKNLTEMSMLDPDALDGPFLHEGHDLYTGVTHAANDVEISDRLRTLFLPVLLPRNEAMKTEVEKLVDEEMRTLKTALPGTEHSMTTKVCTSDCLGLVGPVTYLLDLMPRSLILFWQKCRRYSSAFSL